MASRKDRPESPPASGLVRDLIAQFDDPMDFYRELVQNSIDAGANRIDVTLRWGEGSCLIRVEDDGRGMDAGTIDGALLVPLASQKDGDLTKVGGAGFGFLSVFAVKPERVRVLTGQGTSGWQVDMSGPAAHEKKPLEEPREGTAVEILKAMDEAEFRAFVEASRSALQRWCRHSEARVFFAAPDAPSQLVVQPFALAGASLRYAEEGTEIELGFTDEPSPSFGLYNRGLTIAEGCREFIPGVRFKAKSRYLSPDLSRSGVLDDENYRKLLAILRRLAEAGLPAKLREESERTAQAAAGDPARAAADWGRRGRFLEHLAAGDRAGRIADWAMFPTLSGLAVSLAALRSGLKAGGGKLCFDEARTRVSGLLERRGTPVLLAGPWVAFAERRLGAGALRVSAAFIAPEPIADGFLPKGVRGLLESLRRLDAACGPKYAGIAAADLAGGAAEDRLFVTQKEPGTLSAADEAPAKTVLFFRSASRVLLLNAGHPHLTLFARLHGERPGLASFLCLKSVYLNDGEVPAGQAERFCSLAEKLELRLLREAMGLEPRRTGRRDGAS
ncbi:MAG: hypothetical protein A2X36_01305 [Elusimicrobia bacterium GWA2_69_24]|nr:MAG: hypothetical protein A2X36_01305 [Elusimicrobia bacterium GWA2_69_24]